MSGLLAAIFQGLGQGSLGFPKGLQEAEQNRQAQAKEQLGADTLAAAERHRQATEQQAQAQLAETQRANKAREDAEFVDLAPEVATSLGLPTGRQHKSLLPLFEKLTEKTIARQNDLQRNKNLQDTLGRLAEGSSRPVPSEFGADADLSALVRQPDPGWTRLQQLVPGLGHEKMGPLINEYNKELAAQQGKPKFNSHIINGEDAPYNVTTDQTGRVTGPAQKIEGIELKHSGGSSFEERVAAKRLRAKANPNDPQAQADLAQAEESMKAAKELAGTRSYGRTVGRKEGDVDGPVGYKGALEWYHTKTGELAAQNPLALRMSPQQL